MTFVNIEELRGRARSGNQEVESWGARSTISVLDLLQLGSAFSLRSFARLGSMMAVLDVVFKAQSAQRCSHTCLEAASV